MRIYLGINSNILNYSIVYLDIVHAQYITTVIHVLLEILLLKIQYNSCAEWTLASLFCMDLRKLGTYRASFLIQCFIQSNKSIMRAVHKSWLAVWLFSPTLSAFHATDCYLENSLAPFFYLFTEHWHHCPIDTLSRNRMHCIAQVTFVKNRLS